MRFLKRLNGTVRFTQTEREIVIDWYCAKFSLLSYLVLIPLSLVATFTRV